MPFHYQDVGIFKCESLYKSEKSIMRHYGIVAEWCHLYLLGSNTNILVKEVIEDFKDKQSLLVKEVIEDFKDKQSLLSEVDISNITEMVNFLLDKIRCLLFGKNLEVEVKDVNKIYYFKGFKFVLEKLQDEKKKDIKIIDNHRNFSFFIKKKIYKLLSLFIILFKLRGLPLPIDINYNIYHNLPYFDKSYTYNNADFNTKSIKEMYDKFDKKNASMKGDTKVFQYIQKNLKNNLFINDNKKTHRYIPLGCLFPTNDGPYLYNSDKFNVGFSLNNFIFSESSLVGLFILLDNNELTKDCVSENEKELKIKNIAPSLFFNLNDYLKISRQYLENNTYCSVFESLLSSEYVEYVENVDKYNGTLEDLSGYLSSPMTPLNKHMKRSNRLLPFRYIYLANLFNFVYIEPETITDNEFNIIKEILNKKIDHFNEPNKILDTIKKEILRNEVQLIITKLQCVQNIHYIIGMALKDSISSHTNTYILNKFYSFLVLLFLLKNNYYLHLPSDGCFLREKNKYIFSFRI